MTEKSKITQSSDPINLKELLTYCAGNEKLAQKVLDSFVQVSSMYYTELSDALESGNSEEVRAQCHKIRGAGAIVHAEPLLEIVSQIRQNAIDAEVDRAKSYLSELEKALADIVSFVESSCPVSS